METIILISPNHIYSTRQKEEYRLIEGKWYLPYRDPIRARENVERMLEEELNYKCNIKILKNLTTTI